MNSSYKAVVFDRLNSKALIGQNKYLKSPWLLQLYVIYWIWIKIFFKYF